MTPLQRPPLPAWLPQGAQLYLDHVVCGLSLRALARREGCNPSTVMRLVRRYEGRRDDPLLDAALNELAACAQSTPPLPDLNRKDPNPMSVQIRPLDEATILREARRVLRRLAEPGAVMVIAPDLEKAAVMRSVNGGDPITTTSLDRKVAQAFAVKDWIACSRPGRVARYELTSAGRAALRRMVETETGAERTPVPGMAEAASPFAAQHRDMVERDFYEPDGARRARVNLSESPVSVLGRRRDKAGKPFLAPELVSAAERMREDFEVAQMGPRVAQNWDRFLTVGDRGNFRADSGLAEGPRSARDRVDAALRCLGPVLSDLTLRVCCHLDGIEATEARLGLSARSGKELLRIALMQLRRHYDETYGRSGPLIG